MDDEQLLLEVDTGGGHIGLQSWGFWISPNSQPEILTSGGFSDDLISPKCGEKICLPGTHHESALKAAVLMLIVGCFRKI